MKPASTSPAVSLVVAFAAAVCAASCSIPELHVLMPPTAAPPVVNTIGTVTDPALTELSGLAASRRNPGTFWAHNDSSHPAMVFALDASGKTIAHVMIEGAQNVDWEDLAVGPGADGRSTLFIGDVGDNLRMRQTVTIYRVPEPLLGPAQGGAAVEITAVADPLELKYAGGPRNAEALIRDPLSNRIYVVSKEKATAALVFATDAAGAAGTTAELQKVGAVQFGPTKLAGAELAVTGGSISFDGMRVALRTNALVAEWNRERGESVEKALARVPERTIELRDDEGEAIAYGPDAAIFLSREGTNPPILRIDGPHL